MVPKKYIFSEKFLSLLFIGLVVLADQIVKFLVVNSGISYVCNIKFAFGIGSDLQLLNVIIPVLLVVTAVYFAIKSQEPRRRFPLILVIGGGTANLVDRFIFGCVRDFIDLKYWPVFNLADAAIFIGAVLFALQLKRPGKKIT